MERLTIPYAVRLTRDDFDHPDVPTIALQTVCLGALARMRAAGFDPDHAIARMAEAARAAADDVGVLRRLCVHTDDGRREWLVLDFVTPGARTLLYDVEAPAEPDLPPIPGDRSAAIMVVAQYASEHPAEHFCTCWRSTGGDRQHAGQWVVCVDCKRPILSLTFAEAVRPPFVTRPTAGTHVCAICAHPIEGDDIAHGPQYGPAGTLVLAGSAAHPTCVERCRFQ